MKSLIQSLLSFALLALLAGCIGGDSASPDNNAAVKEKNFQYKTQPTLTLEDSFSCTPMRVSHQGGSLISCTLLEEHALDQDLTVSIDGRVCTDLKLIDEKSFECQVPSTPRNDLGIKDMFISNVDSPSLRLQEALIYTNCRPLDQFVYGDKEEMEYYSLINESFQLPPLCGIPPFVISFEQGEGELDQRSRIIKMPADEQVVKVLVVDESKRELKININVISDVEFFEELPQTSKSLPGPLIDRIKNEMTVLNDSFPCRQGTRLNQVVFASTKEFSTNQLRTYLNGPYQEELIEGVASEIYFGLGVFGEFMLVSRMLNGDQVEGYNIFLSMCSYETNNVPLITDIRELSNFQSSSPIILDDELHCGYSVVEAAMNTVVMSNGIEYMINGQNISLASFEVNTNFYGPTCNGSY